MLLQFKAKNYKSIGDEVTLNMVAGSGTEHKHFIMDYEIQNGVKILPVASIYGSNASGKSNIIDALASMLSIMVNSYQYGDKNNIAVTPFFYDEKLRGQPTKFEIFIAIEGREYQYGFDATRDEIVGEWMYERKLSAKSSAEFKLIFDRTKDEINYHEKYQKFNKFDNLINKKMLLLSFLGRTRINDTAVFNSILNWTFHYMTDDAGNKSLQDDIDYWSEIYLNNDELKNEFVKFINEFDPMLENIIVNEETNKDGVTRHRVFTVHHGIQYPIDIESDGTKKLFVYFVVLYTHFNHIRGIFIVDELDSQLHPLVLRRIVNMYHDKEVNKMGSQLIFSSHNLIVLDNHELRRDEIWFTEKDKKGYTRLFSLAEFKTNDKEIRADLNFGKNYLAGRFGAIPYLNQEEE